MKFLFITNNFESAFLFPIILSIMYLYVFERISYWSEDYYILAWAIFIWKILETGNLVFTLDTIVIQKQKKINDMRSVEKYDLLIRAKSV